MNPQLGEQTTSWWGRGTGADKACSPSRGRSGRLGMTVQNDMIEVQIRVGCGDFEGRDEAGSAWSEQRCEASYQDQCCECMRWRRWVTRDAMVEGDSDGAERVEPCAVIECGAQGVREGKIDECECS